MLLKNFKKMFVLVAAATVCAILPPPKPAMAANTDAAKKKVYNVQVTGQFLRKEALELLDLINEERAKVGEEPLVMDGEAVGVSDLRAVQTSFVNSHVVPMETGEGYLGEISKFTTENGPIGDDEFGTENIVVASGYKEENIAELFFESWMNSSGHKEAMLHEMQDRAGITIFTQENIDGLYSYYGVLDSLILEDPSKPSLIPELCKNYVRVPYTQGDQTVTKTFHLSLKGSCISMNTKRYQGNFSIKIGLTQSKKLIALYNAISRSHFTPEGYCLNRFDDACGTWTTSTPDIVSVNQNGVVTGLKAGTGKVFFNLNGDSDKSSEYTIQVKATNIGTPSNVTVKKVKDNKVTIFWKDKKSASGYQIYRSKTKNGNYSLLTANGIDKETTVSAKPGQTYYYKIRAFTDIDSDDTIYGNFSKPVKYTCPVSQKKTPSLSAGAKKILIRWSKTGGADGTRICYYQKEGGRNVNIRYKNVAGSSVLSYTLAGLKGGTYYVKVRAYSLVDGKKVYGKYSSAKKIYVK